MAQRLTPRIVPPAPITVSIEERGGPLVALGLIADISGQGACVWTDTHLAVGKTLNFRISFAQPPEIHQLTGAVVWDRTALPERGTRNRARCGVQWYGASKACRYRLRELAEKAVPPARWEKKRFEKAWRVANS